MPNVNLKSLTLEYLALTEEMEFLADMRRALGKATRRVLA